MAVYFITDEQFVKIGFSEVAPYDRLASLQTGNPRRLRMLAFDNSAGQPTEYDLHRIFSADRVHGEWFRRSTGLNQLIDEVGRGVPVRKWLAKLAPGESSPEPVDAEHPCGLLWSQVRLAESIREEADEGSVRWRMRKRDWSWDAVLTCKIEGAYQRKVFRLATLDKDLTRARLRALMGKED